MANTENKQVPKHLYRGLKLLYQNLDKFDFTADLVVNYAPIINELGQETVSDGNEYGVYMSDNLRMVQDSYGKIHNDGTPIDGKVAMVKIPAVSIIYDITTTNLDVREPQITSVLKGHYNNGYIGREWIADKIPKENYNIMTIKIGADLLHDEEDIDPSDLEKLPEILKKKLTMRKYRLEMLATMLSQMPIIKRNALTKSELEILRSIYGEDGLRYINEDALDTRDVVKMLTFLQAKVFAKNGNDIDFQTMKYLQNMKDRCDSVESLVATLEEDAKKNREAERNFVARKEKEKAKYSTKKFEREENRIQEIKEILLKRINHDRVFYQEDTFTLDEEPVGFKR